METKLALLKINKAYLEQNWAYTKQIWTKQGPIQEIIGPFTVKLMA